MDILRTKIKMLHIFIAIGIAIGGVAVVKVVLYYYRCNYPQYQYERGLYYAENAWKGIEDPFKSVECFRKAAELGHAEAQYRLGDCYECARGVNKDLREAFKWYRKAAKQGHAEAQYRLGKCYEYGEGVEKDSAKAAMWYRKAAEQGDESAKFSLKYL